MKTNNQTTGVAVEKSTNKVDKINTRIEKSTVKTTSLVTQCDKILKNH